MVILTKLARKLPALMAGAMIGTFLGYLTDQTLTNYVLQHSENMATIIVTNALSAFLLFPLIVILSAYAGIRLIKQSTPKK
jgi:TctA family transporter